MSYYPKTCNFTICSIFSHSGHVVWCTASSDTILKLDTLVMVQTKFGFNWSSSFRGEYFWKSLRRTTDDDDGRQVMAIAHARWAKKAKIGFGFLLLLLFSFTSLLTPHRTLVNTHKINKCAKFGSILLDVSREDDDNIVSHIYQIL